MTEQAMKTVIAGALMTILATQAALSAEGDMKLGTFGRTFCGAPATFEVTSDRGDWVFEGKVHIRDTGEYDRVIIKQYDDNSLRITRYLSGQHSGQKQWARTKPPKFHSINGRPVAVFFVSHGNGLGCNNHGAATQLDIFD